MGPTKTEKLGNVYSVSGWDARGDLIFDEPKHHQDAAQAGMKEE